jgi:hypothetical protein
MISEEMFQNDITVLVNNELERTWKETVEDYFKVLFQHLYTRD